MVIRILFAWFIPSISYVCRIAALVLYADGRRAPSANRPAFGRTAFGRTPIKRFAINSEPTQGNHPRRYWFGCYGPILIP